MIGRKRSGFTVLELIIVIFIVGVLGAIVAATLTKSLQDNARVEQETIVQRDLSLALDRVGKVIRSTTQLLAASQTNLKIRGYARAADLAPSEIEYYLDNGAWKLSVIAASGTPPNYTYLPGNKVVSLLAGKLTNDLNDPLFRFYDQKGLLLSFPVIQAAVTVIEIRPKGTDSKSSLTKPVELSTKVHLRNFKTNL